MDLGNLSILLAIGFQSASIGVLCGILITNVKHLRIDLETISLKLSNVRTLAYELDKRISNVENKIGV